MTLSDMRCSRLARRHGARLSAFFFIGAAVFVVGLAFQVALVRYAGLGADSSYVAQAILSIELSYLLNRYLTWRNRDAGFWLACWKFTAQKLIMTVVNMAAYALLVRVGVQYVAANIALTAVFTPVNYFAADLLVFVRPRRPRPRHRRRRAGRASAAVRAMAGEASGAADEMAGRTAAEVAGALVGAADGLLGRAVAGEAANQPKAPALTEVILVGTSGTPPAPRSKTSPTRG
ncbi:MAG: hypothetical protein JWM19_5405 [Actinomycetia bacterium]|nr:hypothetical protein [Actinomycetes bacterium]